MLTAKGKYGLKALVHLSSLPKGETAQSVDIAEANSIPKKFLDAILGDLRNAGVVHSKKGPGGGYMLARAPGEIKVGHVIRAMIRGALFTETALAADDQSAWKA